MSGDKFRCELWKAWLPGSPDQWLIAKPQTFMNLSGECVQPLAAWHRLLPENILVVHDELDIAPGRMKFKRRGGGNAGHNGLKSITQRLGTPGFLPPSPRHRPFPAWRRGHRELGSRAAQSRGAGRLPANSFPPRWRLSVFFAEGNISAATHAANAFRSRNWGRRNFLQKALPLQPPLPLQRLLWVGQIRLRFL